MEFFLTVFPFVYISKNENDTLFYNTISGENIQFKNNILVAEIAERLEQQDYACVVNKDEFEKLNQVDFLTLLVEKNLGYYIDRKHFQLLPAATRCVEINNQDFTAHFRNNEYIMENLREVTFYINSDADDHTVNRFRKEKSHKQFLSPKYESPIGELLLSKIEKIVGEIGINKLSINILGGNIFKYSQIEFLIKFLNETTYNISYYFHYYDWIKEYSQQIISSINEYDTKIILIDFPFNETQFEQWEDLFAQKNVWMEFLVETDEQIEEAEIIINKFKLNNYIFKPYYNGNNYEFFKENVFVSEEDILSVKESLFELIAKKISNPSFFGKLTFGVHGNVYSNPNLPPISHIDNLNLKHLIYELLTDDNSIWLSSRIKADPCKKCIYNLLCPPISNYEIIFGQNNLCHLNK